MKNLMLKRKDHNLHFYLSFLGVYTLHHPPALSFTTIHGILFDLNPKYLQPLGNVLSQVI